jgi:hypothetical protein
MWLNYVIASLKAFQKAGFEESHVTYILNVKIIQIKEMK